MYRDPATAEKAAEPSVSGLTSVGNVQLSRSSLAALILPPDSPANLLALGEDARCRVRLGNVFQDNLASVDETPPIEETTKNSL